MQAIILAAGLGRRLKDLTAHNTKCMVKVNGVTLIERMLKQLAGRNLSRIVLVVGYKAESLVCFVKSLGLDIPIVFIENPIYDKTNNIYSLALAKEYLTQEDTLLLESDLIFEDAVLDKILQDPYPTIALVNKYENWNDGTCVKISDDGRIESFIAKNNFKFAEKDSYYKTINIYKFSKEFSAKQYVPFLEAYCQALGHNGFYEQVLRVLSTLENAQIRARTLQGERWYEIDDMQDLDTAEMIFSQENTLQRYQKRFGGYWRFSGLKDFCYLVNPYFPPQKMCDEIKSNFEDLLCQYPSGAGVMGMLAAKNFDVYAPYLAVGNGAAEIIKELLPLLPGKMGVIYPTFEEYPNRKQQDLVIWTPQTPGFSYTAKDVMAYFEDKAISSLLLINPDNPSGNFIGKEDLLALLDWCRAKQVRLVLDESFVDFSEKGAESSLLKNDILVRYPQMIILKSISKSYGVPGLRLGIAASADTALMDDLRRRLSIWNINSFAEFFLQIYHKYEADYKNACQLFAQERETFYQQLKKISYLRVYPSQANYFLCEVLPPKTATALAEELLKRKIFIKDCSAKKGFAQKNYIRIAIRNRADNEALIKALQS